MAPRRSMTLAALMAGLTGSTTAEAAAPSLVAGTERISQTTSDPAGGPVWALKTWRARPASRFSRQTVTCVQFGRLRGGQLVRTFASGTSRVMTREDRSVCATVGPRDAFDWLPQIIERIADDPARPTRFTRTVLGGVARGDVRAIDIVARGRTRRVDLSPRRRAWLAVLPGSVKRSQVAILYRGRTKTWRVDFRTGRRSGDREFSRLVAGSVRRPLVVSDPTGGPRVALTRFATHDRKSCVEPGRLIAGEAGLWSAEWGSFLDMPTLVPLTAYSTGEWQPAASTPQSTNGCTNRFDDDGPVAALVARRLGPQLVALGGIVKPGTRRLAIRRPDGRYARLAVRDGAFLAALPSTGALGESAALEVTDRRGKRTSRPLPTGDQDLPTDIDRIDVVENGSVLRVQWLGGFEPFSGVDVLRAPGKVSVTVFTRYAPEFAPDGTSYGSLLIGIPKCIDLVLPEPLNGETPTDHRGSADQLGTPDPEGLDRPEPPDPGPCVRVAPGFRDDIPLTNDPAGDEGHADLAARR